MKAEYQKGVENLVCKERQVCKTGENNITW